MTGTQLPNGGDAVAFAFAAAINPEEAKKNAPGWYTGSWMESIFEAIAGGLSWPFNVVASLFGYDAPSILEEVATELPKLANTADANIPDAIVNNSINRTNEIIRSQHSGLSRFSTPDLHKIGNETHDAVQLAVEEVFIKGELSAAGVNVEKYSYDDINTWLAGNNDYQTLKATAVEFANQFSDSAQQAISGNDKTHLNISNSIASYGAAQTAMSGIVSRVNELTAHATTIDNNSLFKAIGLTTQQGFSAAQAMDAGQNQTDSSAYLLASELTSSANFSKDAYDAAIASLNDQQKADLELIKNDFEDFDIEVYAPGGHLKGSVLLQGNGKEVPLVIR